MSRQRRSRRSARDLPMRARTPSGRPHPRSEEPQLRLALDPDLTQIAHVSLARLALHGTPGQQRAALAEADRRIRARELSAALWLSLT